MKRWIRLAVLLQLGLAGGLVLLAWQFPLGVDPTDVSRGAAENPEVRLKASESDSYVDDFRTILGRRFQSPLFDPPPPPPPEVVAPPPPTPPQIQLLATMIEASGNQAMITDSSGETSIRGVGALVAGGSGDASIVEIRPEELVVEYAGEQFTLSLRTR